MNINQHFIKIGEINFSEKVNYYPAIGNYLSLNLQLLLMSDGSLTNNLGILTQAPISLKLLSQEEHIFLSSILDQSIICAGREVLLTTNKQANIIFAKSYYKKNILPSHLIKTNKPLGKSFIESETEIYRTINSIYFGYSNILEKKFQIKGPLWGRSYHILYERKILLLIHEFFSPSLTKKI